jgi:hypothetical protein
MIAAVIWDIAVFIVKGYALLYLGLGVLLAACVAAGLLNRMWSAPSDEPQVRRYRAQQGYVPSRGYVPARSYVSSAGNARGRTVTPLHRR